MSGVTWLLSLEVNKGYDGNLSCNMVGKPIVVRKECGVNSVKENDSQQIGRQRG